MCCPVVEFRRKKDVKDDPDLCSVKGCQEPVKRSLSGKAVKKAVPDMEFKVKDPKKVRLCKEHYKEYKKATKEERKLERMSWDK
jgi:hypothetical protein